MIKPIYRRGLQQQEEKERGEGERGGAVCVSGHTHWCAASRASAPRGLMNSFRLSKGIKTFGSPSA